jgi:hypothetical protein
METPLSMPTIRDQRRGRTVASFRDARGAVLAVHELLRHGIAADCIAMQPAAMSVPNVLARTPRDRHVLARRATVASALVATVAFIAVAPSLAAVFLAPVVGCIAGAIVGEAVRLPARVLGWRIARARRRVDAQRFDIVVAGVADVAEHELARWWDPEAPPSRRSAA